MSISTCRRVSSRDHTKRAERPVELLANAQYLAENFSPQLLRAIRTGATVTAHFGAKISDRAHDRHGGAFPPGHSNIQLPGFVFPVAGFTLRKPSDGRGYAGGAGLVLLRAVDPFQVFATATRREAFK